MDKVFARLDKSVTPLGAQYLYALLRTCQRDPGSLHDNVQACRAFTENANASAAAKAALKKLNRSESADLAGFLLGPPVTIPARHTAFYFLSAAAIACPFGMFLSRWFMLPAMCLWLLNVFVHCRYGSGIPQHASALRSLATLLASVPQLIVATQKLSLPELQNLKKLSGLAAGLQKKISRTFLRSSQSDDLTIAVIEYLNILCLFELTSFCRAIVALNEHRDAVVQLFQCVARIDAFQGLSTSLSNYPTVCAAELKAGRTFSFIDAYHPLVEEPVPNSIHGSGNSILLSGTNMAGKTTFMKTLALNLILAQTIGFCLASKAVVPPARVRTLIDRDDTPASGQSYFFFEAKQVLRMLVDAQSSDRESWFVIDEIFRGTNSVERVAAGSAVLSHLTSAGVVVASTHDQEIADQLGNEFDSYHFLEVVNGGEIGFDYRLRSGMCSSRNAIKLLIRAGYPKHITDLAVKLADEAESRC
jgi:hypothetical protein